VAPAEYARRVEEIIRRHCPSEQAEMLVLARNVEMSVRQSPAREG
jgi:hypothetical protein